MQINVPAEIGSTIYYVRADRADVMFGKVIGFQYNSLDGKGLCPTVNSEFLIDGSAFYPVSKWYNTYEEAAERLSLLQDPFPVLTTIKKLDQKNRLNIPNKYMELLGIAENSEVALTCDKRGGFISITRVAEVK